MVVEPRDLSGARAMNGKGVRLQSLTTEQFFYFFFRLRKGEVRKTVATVRNRYPSETEQQLAARLIQSKARLTLLGGTLITLPQLLPGPGLLLKLSGTVGATSMLTRMNLYLILEIALLFGKDIDDQARVAEMATVIAATGLSAGMPLIAEVLGLHPIYAVPVGALSATAATRTIGHTAVKFYMGRLEAQPVPEGEVSLPVAALSASQ